MVYGSLEVRVVCCVRWLIDILTTSTMRSVSEWGIVSNENLPFQRLSRFRLNLLHSLNVQTPYHFSRFLDRRNLLLVRFSLFLGVTLLTVYGDYFSVLSLCVCLCVYKYAIWVSSLTYKLSKIRYLSVYDPSGVSRNRKNISLYTEKTSLQTQRVSSSNDK